MRRYPEKGGQFAIIWVDLLYEDAVPASGKLLFGEIYRLSNADGWCDASNKEFMDLLGCSESTVRNLLRSLEDVGQIRVETQPKRDGSGGTERRIFCGRKLAPPDLGRVPAENCGYPGGTRKNLRGVPAENCGSYKVLNNNTSNTPLYPPMGDACGKTRKSKSTPAWMPDAFEAFWNLYRTHGRAEDRVGAVHEWDRLKPDQALIQTMTKALETQSKGETWRRGIGIPYACRWIKNERWKDTALERSESDQEAEPPRRRYVGKRIIDGQEVDVYE